jgi:hypothetical protein
MQYDILTPPTNYQPANDYQGRVLSPQERLERDSFIEKIEAIIDINLSGNESKAAHELETLIAVAPENIRAELRQLYNSRLNEARRDFNWNANQNEAQIAVLKKLQQAEQLMNADFISRRSMRQMRVMFLRNPQLLQIVTEIAKLLLQHGVTGVANLNQNQLQSALNTPTNQPDLQQNVRLS